jgi:hypothetical protein
VRQTNGKSGRAPHEIESDKRRPLMLPHDPEFLIISDIKSIYG